jgi:RimJ/RimL family protein N-acetyltransferase
MIPTLETNRLKLIAPSVDCFDSYCAFFLDAEASKMYGGPLKTEQIWMRLKADAGSWHLFGFGVWIIQLKSDNSLIGTCGFWRGKEWPKELTWWVLPEYRGLGIATEASKAALNYAYEQLNWDSVQTCMNDENVGAHALAKKLGGVVSQRKVFPDGITRDVYKLSKPI